MAHRFLGLSERIRKLRAAATKLDFDGDNGEKKIESSRRLDLSDCCETGEDVSGPSNHQYKASIFFRLSADQIENLLTSLESFNRDLLAFFGDSFLNYKSVCYLQKPDFECYQFTLKLLTILRSMMVSNKTLDTLCKEFFYRDIDQDRISHLNTHSKGTILEAIIELCRRENGEEVASEKLFLLFDFLKPTLIHFIENDLKELPLGDIDMTPIEMDRLHTIFDSHLKAKCRVISLQTVKQLNDFLPKERLEAAHWVLQVVGDKHFSHSGEVVDVNWRSRKGYYYESPYYTCCGRPVDSRGVQYSRICPRSSWNNSLSFHPGKLRVSSSRRCGGGGVGSRGVSDHIPICREPVWSCCFSAASSEGCQVLQGGK
jgi:hypothetical protein